MIAVNSASKIVVVRRFLAILNYDDHSCKNEEVSKVPQILILFDSILVIITIVANWNT